MLWSRTAEEFNRPPGADDQEGAEDLLLSGLPEAAARSSRSASPGRSEPERPFPLKALPGALKERKTSAGPPRAEQPRGQQHPGPAPGWRRGARRPPPSHTPVHPPPLRQRRRRGARTGGSGRGSPARGQSGTRPAGCEDGRGVCGGAEVRQPCHRPRRLPPARPGPPRSAPARGEGSAPPARPFPPNPHAAAALRAQETTSPSMPSAAGRSAAGPAPPRGALGAVGAGFPLRPPLAPPAGHRVTALWGGRERGRGGCCFLPRLHSCCPDSKPVIELSRERCSCGRSTHAVPHLRLKGRQQRGLRSEGPPVVASPPTKVLAFTPIFLLASLLMRWGLRDCCQSVCWLSLRGS